MQIVDVLVIGAGAAGMMCAIEAARRGRRVMVVDHNRAPGEKIRISGGGRCNFTNLHCAPSGFLSENPKFILSALSRYSQWDFIQHIDRAGIAWHEKTLGQLFCDGSAKEIVALLVRDMAQGGVDLRLGVEVGAVAPIGEVYAVDIGGQAVQAVSLVIATGGKSIPKMGASGFGYQVATQFGLSLVTQRPGLVPLTFAPHILEDLKPLAGLSAEAVVSSGTAQFREGLLFTHRGLSGPSILQISSYWREGDEISIDLAPGQDVSGYLRARKHDRGGQAVLTVLSDLLPKRLAALLTPGDIARKTLGDLNEADIQLVSSALQNWQLKPTGSEGYRTAEVTLGGVSTAALDARTMEARRQKGLFFIGEVVDVTGWLGGYNFQWAWSSGWAAGQVV
jgi:predicted Rossmann fold flavoprotein